MFAENDFQQELFRELGVYETELNQYEQELVQENSRLVELLSQAASRHMLLNHFQDADSTLNRASMAVRVDEGLFSRNQIPFLFMKAENYTNSGNWADARKLQEHLMWFYLNKYGAPDQHMIDGLKVLAGLHLRGSIFDDARYRIYHYTRAAYSNRLALRAANEIWPEKDQRRAEILHGQLRTLHMRASSALEKGFNIFAQRDEENYPGSLVQNLSEQISLGDIRATGMQYLNRLRLVFTADGGNDREGLGMVELYQSEWRQLFGAAEQASASRREARRLLAAAGVAGGTISELLKQPLLGPEFEFYASAKQALKARSMRSGDTPAANAGAGLSQETSFTSLALLPGPSA